MLSKAKHHNKREKRKIMPGLIYRIMRKMNPNLVRNYDVNSKSAKFLLLLTTKGRKSGLPRVTPVQYEQIDGAYYIGSARGDQADWYKNILACPRVDVRVGDNNFSTTAQVINDPKQIADFLEYRMQRNSFIRFLTHMEGLPIFHKRIDLERFASTKVVFILTNQAGKEVETPTGSLPGDW
jgi:deazaflavin-dependent oxidoreductase (nitroreductase family)